MKFYLPQKKVWLGLALFMTGSCMSLHAEAACSVNQGITLDFPATLDLTTSTKPGDILASGLASTTPWTCTPSTPTGKIDWIAGTDGGNDVRILASGIGLKLNYLSQSTGAHDVSSGGATSVNFDWTGINWSLVRLSETATTGSTSFSSVIARGQMTDPESGLPVTMDITAGRLPVLTALCALSVDKTQITLPDTETTVIKRDGHSDSRDLLAQVTCPADTTLSSGTTLTLSTPFAEASDNSLIGNSGSAKGVAIEVLDDKNNRINAQGGAIKQARFTQTGTAAPGATQTYQVRMLALPGAEVEAGTVQGTFTLTLTVN